MRCLMLFSRVLLFVACLGETTALPNVLPNATGSNDGEFPMQTNTSKDDGCLKFTEINNDVLFLIIGHLQFADLMNLTEAIPIISPLTALFLPKMYNEIRIDYAHRIPNKLLNLKIDWSIFKEIPAEKRIDIFDFNLAYNILKYFGGVIQRLSIYNYHIDYNESNAISEALNVFVSDSLTYLDLGVIKEDTLQKFTAPFGGVEELKIAISVDEVKLGRFTLSQLFPRMNRLNLLMHSDCDYSFVVHQYPRLKHLCLVVSKMIFHQKNQIKAILQKNKQIRSFELEFAPKQLLKHIAGCLRNIDNLTLNLWHIGDDPVHFEHVQFCKLYHRNQCDRGSVKSLSFSQLQSLESTYSLVEFDAYINFFRKHQNLTRLHLTAHMFEKTAQFVQLTAQLPNLIDLTLDCNAYMTAENVAQIIDNHKKMQTFQLLKLRIGKEQINNLREQFESDWHIKNISDRDWPGFLFEKKN